MSTNANAGDSAPAKNEEALERRGFIKLALGAVGICYAGAIGYPVYRYLTSPAEMAAAQGAVSEVSLKDADKLPKGTALMFKFGPRPAMLIHHEDNQWVALDAVCTHLGCTVQYTPQRKLVTCACHGGEYDPHTGKNVGGPPPHPLKTYLVKVQEGSVLVSRA